MISTSSSGFRSAQDRTNSLDSLAPCKLQAANRNQCAIMSAIFAGELAVGNKSEGASSSLPGNLCSSRTICAHNLPGSTQSKEPLSAVSFDRLFGHRGPTQLASFPKLCELLHCLRASQHKSRVLVQHARSTENYQISDQKNHNITRWISEICQLLNIHII